MDIKVEFFHSLQSVPEFILFQAIPLFSDMTALQWQLYEFEENVTNCLNKHDIQYKKEEKLYEMDTGEIVYSYQPVRFKLTWDQYKLIKPIFLEFDEIVLTVVDIQFTPAGLSTFAREVVEMAETHAAISAIKNNKILGKIKKLEDITLEDLDNLFPFGEGYDHFKKVELFGVYKAVFEASAEE